MSDTGRIEGRQRLDRALVEATRDAGAVTRAQVEAFEAMLRARRRANARAGSLQDEIDQIAMPEIADSGIFRAGRPREILQYVLQQVLPRLDAEDEVLAIAQTLLGEEISRQEDIEARRSEDDAAL